MPHRVRGIRSVELEVGSVAAASQFYRDVWKLEPLGDDGRYFRGTASYHHVVALHPIGTGGPCIRRVVFDIADLDQLRGFHSNIKVAGFAAEEPHQLPGPAGGIGFGFKDLEGRNFVLACDCSDHSGQTSRDPDRPHKVTHINLNAGDYQGTVKFFIEVLGFRRSDESARATFLRGDSPDHFTVAVVKSTDATLNHIAFEMVDIDAVMRGAGRMIDNGYPIEWGVGRHGPGNNVFAYFAGPDEMPLEYTAEVLQIDDTYVPRGPDYWKFPSGRTDQWGVTQQPTKRLARIQQLFRFAADGHRT